MRLYQLHFAFLALRMIHKLTRRSEMLYSLIGKMIFISQFSLLIDKHKWHEDVGADELFDFELRDFHWENSLKNVT